MVRDIFVYTRRRTAPAPVPGDADKDGSVGMGDLNTMVDWILLRVAPPVSGSDVHTNADVDGDDTIGMADLNLMVDYILGRITQFPGEG